MYMYSKPNLNVTSLAFSCGLWYIVVNNHACDFCPPFNALQGILDLKVWKSFCGFTIPVPQSKFYTQSPDDALISYSNTSTKSNGTSVLLPETETIL